MKRLPEKDSEWVTHEFTDAWRKVTCYIRKRTERLGFVVELAISRIRPATAGEIEAEVLRRYAGGRP